ncbi:S8 family serine peptidase [Streptomyces sp. NBC_00234]|uniref:S8 family serine peptidase n=1 Tax=Streptomyces sp. NBC_00234 TaxID=2903638 RepID=UPI002E2BDB23|nr:S8 family serine peptidase [Streptomyces sp. NBC_00234]
MRPSRPPSRRRIRLGALLAAALAVTTVMQGGGAAGAGPAPAGTPAAPPAGARSHTLPLITGDTVRVWQLPGGKRGAVLEPGPGRAGTQAITTDRNGSLSVVPLDAWALLQSGRLDTALFDIDTLEAQGLRNGGELPLIVDYPSSGARSLTAATVPEGLENSHRLESIGAIAGTADRAGAVDLWKDLTAESGPAAATARTTLSGGVSRVWLDRMVKASLDRSVPQIGAPEAWQAGYDGKGVKVAVLDTGVDPTHPDVKDALVESRNFTPDADAVDHYGHGTHVAATVAGSGAASGGRLKGVAPGAQILNGKVLADRGGGQASWIIEGMEWAAASGADIISMSLGGPAGRVDAGDPMVEAVDRISKDSGTLFVIASGNDSGAVSTPGVADSALTVGAVDKQDVLAAFSNFGPRLGDSALKPDITAPGVGIVAARAAGTSLGTLVGDQYTTLSGTSMATPHVAGAAALLAQQHPDWTGQQLKAALMSSAEPSSAVTAWKQGAGRADVARAVRQNVTVDGNVSFGLLPFARPYAKAERTLTYRNQGDGPVTLDLSADFARTSGGAGKAGLVLSADRIEIPAGGATDVTASFAPQSGDQGSWAGRITATAADGVRVTAAVGGVVQTPISRLSVTGTDRAGAPAAGASGWLVMNLDTDSVEYRSFDAEGRDHQDLPAGRYSVWSWIVTPGKDGGAPSLSLDPVPDLTVGEDPISLDFDARDDVRLSVVTPRSTDRRELTVGVFRTDSSGQRFLTQYFGAGAASDVYVQPGGTAVSVGNFELTSQWFLTEAGKSPADASYTYDLMFAEKRKVGQDLSYRPDSTNTATVRARYFAPGGPETAKVEHQSRMLMRPYGTYINISGRMVTLGKERTEYLTADRLVSFQDKVTVSGADGSYRTSAYDGNRSYTPGAKEDMDYFGPVVRPALDTTGTYQPYRLKDTLAVHVPEWVDGSDQHRTRAVGAYDRTAGRIYRNGELLRSGAGIWGLTATTPEKASYRMELDVDRTASWWTRSTSTRTAWTFVSERPADGVKAGIPLLSADYSLPSVRMDGTVPEGHAVPFTVGMRRPAGAPEPTVGELTVEVSYDGGTTWTAAPGERDGNRLTGAITPPKEGLGDGFVALRVKAADTEGNAFEQTVLRAVQYAAK